LPKGVALGCRHHNRAIEGWKASKTGEFAPKASRIVISLTVGILTRLSSKPMPMEAGMAACVPGKGGSKVEGTTSAA
jgi:hypothetical protein